MVIFLLLMRAGNKRRDCPSIPARIDMNERTLILIHGNALKPQKQDLWSVSNEAMRSGLARESTDLLSAFDQLRKDFPYFGDLTNGYSENAAQDYDELLDLEDRRNALESLKRLDKLKKFSLADYDRLPGKTALKEFAADVVSPVLNAVGLSRKIISRVDQVLGAYWSDELDLKVKILDRIRTPILDAMQRNDRILLLSHGIGSVYAFDALWQISNTDAYRNLSIDRKIDIWITTGSPLGDPAIQKNLQGANLKGPERYPHNVITWHNFAAEDDYMSHDKTLSDDYKAMLKQRLISRIKDHRIYNLAVRYGSSNPHSSVGYLNHPSMAKIISSWLT